MSKELAGWSGLTISRVRETGASPPTNKTYKSNDTNKGIKILSGQRKNKKETVNIHILFIHGLMS